MANKFQIKRTSVSGRTPNTTNSANSAFIDAGELAFNLADKKLYSSNGSASFEVGANLASLVTTNATVNYLTITSNGYLVANGTSGTPGQILTTSGTGIYWANNAGSSSTVSVDYFPIGDWGADETYPGDPTNLSDAFGQNVYEQFDCLTTPAGRLARQDLGPLT